MTGQRTSGVSLSTRVTLLTLVAVTLSVLVISVFSIGGVYNLARSEDESRLTAFRRLMVDDLEARLTIVERVVDSLASQSGAGSASPQALGNSVARSAAANAEYFDMLMYTDASGTVLAASPGDRAPATLAGAVFAPSKPGTDAVFAWEEAAVGGAGRLWIFRRASAGRGLTVVGRVRAGFIGRIVDDVASSRGSISALIVDERQQPVKVGAGTVSFDAGALEFAPDSPTGHAGTVAVARSAVGPLSGYYERITAPGLQWRAVALESDQAAMARARSALMPAGLSTLAVAVLAVLIALVYSRRLVAPLKQLERRARDVASGGYVRPLRVARDDEIGRMADAFNDMGTRLNSLQGLAQILASASNLDDVLDSVLNAVGHILGTGDAAILLTDTDAGALVLARGRGLAFPAATLLVAVEDASPITEAYHEQRPATFRGPGGEWTAPIHRLFGADAERAGVVVPLAMRRDVLGVIVVLAPGHRTFTEAQIETLRAFSADAAVAVHNSRLFEHEHVSRTEAEALREVAELIVRPADLGAALETVAGIATSLLDMSGWRLALEGREQLGLAPSRDAEAQRRLMRAWEMVSPGPDGEEAPHFDPVSVTDVGEVPGLAELIGPGAGSAMFIPLVHGSAARGVLVLVDQLTGHSSNARQTALAGTIGRQLWLAMRNAYLLQQARSRAANLETVFRISQAVSSELQLNVVLNRVLDVVQKIFTADAVALMSYDPARRRIVTSMARGVSNRGLLYFEVAPGSDIPGTVFETRTPASYGELERVSTPLAGLAVSQGLHSMIAVPLLARGRSIGVLTAYGREADVYSGQDMELLLTFAAQAALAIDTASLYGKEHHVASILQSSILPERLPPVPGLRTASFYLPAGAEADIGGDYYDLFTTRDGRIVVAIGDVCGKGVLAATKTSMIKYALRGLLSAGASPGEALAELNHLVAMSGDPSDIVTAWVGVIDLEEHRLVFANAGHPPGLLWCPSPGAFTRLAPTGPLLGAVAGVTYDDRTVGFEINDVLLLYTDGVTEARRQSRLFGEGRVRRALRRARGAQQTVDMLLTAVNEFSNGPLRDDAAALAVQFVDGGGPPAES